MLPSFRRALSKSSAFTRRELNYLQNRRFCSSNASAPSAKMLGKIPREPAGQPTCFTHPHLIDNGKLTPFVTQQEYSERREKFYSKLIAEVPNSNKSHLVVIPAASKQFMSAKIPHVFRQNSDFFYLTGCLEPGAILVLKSDQHSNNFKSILFVNEKDARDELWEGTRTGCTLAKTLFHVNETRPVQTFEDYLSNIVSRTNQAILWFSNDCPANAEIYLSLRQLLQKQPALNHADPQKVLHSMRSIKSPAEIELMVETCRIGCEAMNMAMMATKPGVSEHALNAVLEYSWRVEGAEHGAFPPVLAGGERAATIHYIANNQILNDNEMVLCDSGSQYSLYNSDISRTWPVSGKFSSHHRILYDLVLTTQKRLIELLSEFRPPLDQLFEHMCRLLGKYLQEEGIISKNLSGNELIGRAYKLCPHHVSHYLGLDVHDAPLVTRSVPVTSGMVVTVEPGIYIRSDDTNVPPEFRGVGIRIEDDVLLQDNGVLNLTAGAAKEIHQIEEIVGKQYR